MSIESAKRPAASRKAPAGEKFQRVSVIGLGYIGLPTAAMFASHGVDVVGVDVNPDIVDTINRGGIHIVEFDLDALVQAVVKKGTLRAATKPHPADVFVIAVPTPFKAGHEPDLACVDAAAASIAPALRKGNLVILESTSPVGTTRAMAGRLAAARPDLSFPQTVGESADVQIAHCPERVLPGHILKELVSNDRVVGGMTPRCALRAADLYRLFVEGECFLTDDRTAEMVKLTENTYRDVNIAFANELSSICDKLGINVWELIKLANRHPRLNIHQPGPGVGGHCIAVDPWFIVHSAPEESRLIQAARRINDEKPHRVVARVLEKAAAFQNPVIACLGLSYKADIDDLRESPAVKIVKELAAREAGRVLAVEPHVEKLPKSLTALNIPLVGTEEALDKAQVVVLLVNHRAFAQIDRRLLDGKIIIDTRGQWQ